MSVAEGTSRYWISTVSRDHVQTGVEGEFCQACHGKKGGISRMKQGDWLIYYSPKMSFGGKEMCQKFTAIGQIADNNIYQFDMGGGFVPFRRNITHLKNASEQPIRPLLGQLSFTRGNPKWGGAFRFGIFEISKADFELIHNKMTNTKASTKRIVEDEEQSEGLQKSAKRERSASVTQEETAAKRARKGLHLVGTED